MWTWRWMIQLPLLPLQRCPPLTLNRHSCRSPRTQKLQRSVLHGCSALAVVELWRLLHRRHHRWARQLP